MFLANKYLGFLDSNYSKLDLKYVQYCLVDILRKCSINDNWVLDGFEDGILRFVRLDEELSVYLVLVGNDRLVVSYNNCVYYFDCNGYYNNKVYRLLSWELKNNDCFLRKSFNNSGFGYTISNDLYVLSIKIDSLFVRNESYLEKYLASLSLPVDIDDLYRNIYEFSLNGDEFVKIELFRKEDNIYRLINVIETKGSRVLRL